MHRIGSNGFTHKIMFEFPYSKSSQTHYVILDTDPSTGPVE